MEIHPATLAAQMRACAHAAEAAGEGDYCRGIADGWREAAQLIDDMAKAEFDRIMAEAEPWATR